MDSARLNRNEDGYKLLLVVLISALSGYCGSCFAERPFVAKSNCGVLRCNELQVIAPGGREQIKLSTSRTGPTIRLTGKDGGQELVLEVVDSIVPAGPVNKMATIKFVNLKAKQSGLAITQTEHQWSYIDMGDSYSPGYVYISATPTGDHPMSNLCVGPPGGHHSEFFATSNSVKSSAGIPGSEVKFGKSKSDFPYASIEASGQETSLVPSIKH